LFFLPLGSRALWNSDEGRYAEIAREMLELKDWISPHLNYVLYFEKPPLMYWLTAASFILFGQNEFAARFWCAAFGVLTVGVVYLLGRHWKSERTGLLSGGILATSFLYFGLTQYLVLDMALTFWLTLALYAASRILRERPPERVKHYTDFLAVAIAGGILTKGLIALLFPVAVLGLTLAYTRLGVQARKMSWQPALLLAAVLAAPWFVLVSLRYPFFPQFFFIHEHVARFLTTIHHREAPFYFFVPVLLGGFLPWSVFLPKVFHSAFAHHRVAMKRDPVLALLVIWSLFVFLFFSVSQSKLVSYILPIVPALALLVGAAFEDALDEENLPAWVERGVAGLIAIFIGGLVVLKFPQAAPLFKDPAAAVFHAHSDALALILGIGVFILVGVWGMRDSAACLGGVMIVQVLLLSMLSSLSPILDPYLSNRGIAHVLSLQAAPEDRIVGYGVSYENALQSLPFYTKRRMAVFGDVGELETGRDHAEDAGEWFTPEAGAPAALSEMPVGTWVVTNEEHEKVLSQAGVAQTFEPAAREGPLLLLHKIR
jgi:4-amino-4-deoxy-L-arabinose transferase-like glycosyltransferase